MAEKKEFSRMFIASLKRTAANVAPLVREKNKLKREIADREEKLAKVEADIAEYQGPIMRATGGFTSEDLVERVVVEGKPDKNGKPTKSTSYQLKYPETVVPQEDAHDALETKEELPFMTEAVLEPDNTSDYHGIQ